jgi:hypothetical protein
MGPPSTVGAHGMSSGCRGKDYGALKGGKEESRVRTEAASGVKRTLYRKGS